MFCEPSFSFSGEAGIRTLGPASWSTVFETAPIDHSGTSPDLQPVAKITLGRKDLQRYNLFSIPQQFFSKSFFRHPLLLCHCQHKPYGSR